MSTKRKRTAVQVLPDSWVAVLSKTHQNRYYYFNKVTKETTWKNPFKKADENETTAKTPTPTAKKTSRKRKKSNSPEQQKIEVLEEKKVQKPVTKTSTKIKPQNIVTSSDTKTKYSIGKAAEGAPSSSFTPVGKLIENLSQCRGRKELKDVNKSVVSESCKPKSNLPTKVNVKSIGAKADNVQAMSCTTKTQYKGTAQERLSKIRQGNEDLVTIKNTTPCKSSGSIKDYKKQPSNLRNSDFKTSCTNVVGKNLSRTGVKDLMVRRIKQDKKFQERIVALKASGPVNEKIIDQDSSNSYGEDVEMDWEPSDQETMIEHIKTMRKNMNTQSELSNEVVVCPSINYEMESDSIRLILIFDTNIFISCLSFIKEMRDTIIEGMGLPLIYIPWRVLQELDHLKTSSDRQLQTSARRAIGYINECFLSKHPRISGQSFKEFSATVKEFCNCPDDEILQVCLNFKESDQCVKPILITNDKNLESKAIMSHIDAYSKDRFLQENFSAESFDQTRSVEPKSKTAESYSKLKQILNKILGSIMEAELKSAFKEDWKKVVRKKPPWNLIDLLECYVKHWRSVFTFVFRKNVLFLIEDLKERSIKADKGVGSQMEESIRVSRELLMSMKIPQDEYKTYAEEIDQILPQVEELLGFEDEHSDDGSMADDRIFSPASCSTQVSSDAQPNGSVELSDFDRQICREKVKNLFSIIWGHVRDFCCSVSDLSSCNWMNNPELLNNLKNQYPHVMRVIENLVTIVETVLSLVPEEISQENQIIIQFINFLMELNIFQFDATELRNLPMYMAIFCRDAEGRSILQTLVNDLKQFGFEMMNGMKSTGLA